MDFLEEAKLHQLDFESYTDHFISYNIVNDSRWPLVRSQNHNQDEISISTVAQVLLKLGILNWRRGDFEESEQLLLKAKNIFTYTQQDTQFLVQCFVGLALVKTRLEKIDGAIDAYHQAIQLDPENSHLWNNLGNLYLQYDHPDKAKSIFKQSIHRNSEDAIAWNGLAKAFYQNKAVDEAIYAYNRAIDLFQKSNPEQLIAPTPALRNLLATQWFHLAVLYTKKCQYNKAVNALQRILALDSGNSEIWNELGKLYIKMEAYEQSIDSFSNAIERNPEFGEAYLNLAYAYTKTGKYWESTPFYMKSVEMLPSYHERKLASNMVEDAMLDLKENNVNSLEEKDRLEITSYSNNEINWFEHKYIDEYTLSSISDAARNLDKHAKSTTDNVALKDFPNSISLSNQQKTIRGEGNMSCLLPPFKKQHLQAESYGSQKNLLEYNSEIFDPFVWNEKGNIHFKSQDYKEAIISYSRAIEMDPTIGQPFHNLALVQFIQGNYDESILFYRESLKLLTTNQEKAIAWNGLGNVYRRIKDYDNVRRAYQRASELDGNNGFIDGSTTIFEISEEQKTAGFWCDLGRLLFKTGSYQKAASAFQKAIHLTPSSGHAYSYLARALTAQGQYKAAIAPYRKSIDLLPTEKEKSNAWNRLGDVHRKLNDYENALKAYQNATKLSNDKFSLLNRTRISLLSNCAAK